MEKRIRERYGDSILKEAMERYGIHKNQIQLLDGFESFIYDFEKGEKNYILRIAHSIRRSETLIQAEIDWINYLAHGGASVARAIPSESGKLVESIDDGMDGKFLATAFIKAEGRPPREAGWSPKLYETYGRLLGKLHALSKHYKPGKQEWKRLHWNDTEMLDVVRFIPDSEPLVVENFRYLMNHFSKLPQDKASYGLIHQDAHSGNMFVDKTGTITLFDFDDSAYSWYINDIAIVLFYIVMGQEDSVKFTSEFMNCFLRGYRQENSIEAGWFKEIPYFLKLREIDLYAVIHRSFDVNNLDDPWCAGYMKGRKLKIENNVPYIDFDFELLADLN